MPGITQKLPQTAALPSPSLGALFARIRQGLRGALARSRSRRILAGLTDDQLRDIGIDRSTVLGNKPAIGIDAGVGAYLMSMR